MVHDLMCRRSFKTVFHRIDTGAHRGRHQIGGTKCLQIPLPIEGLSVWITALLGPCSASQRRSPV